MSKQYSGAIILLAAIFSTALAKLPSSSDFQKFKPSNNNQFAVLFVTDGTDVFDPAPGNYNSNNMMIGNNYVANTFSKATSTGHTEPTVLDYADTLLKNFKAKKNKMTTPHLVLYTKFTPCCSGVKSKMCGPKSCSYKIAEFVKKNSGFFFYLSWSAMYILGLLPADGQFLTGLNTMLSTGKVTLHSVPHNNWFQEKMAKCLIQKNAVKIMFKGKTEESIRKMVNTIVWELASGSIQSTGRDTWIKSSNKWTTQIEGSLKMKCNKLTAPVVSCVASEGKGVVGPPLKPNDGKVSSSASDLRGGYDYKNIDTAKC